MAFKCSNLNYCLSALGPHIEGLMCVSAIVEIFGFMAHFPKVTLTTQMTRMTQMSMARVPLPTIVVVDSDKSAEDQLRTMVTLYRCSNQLKWN